MRSYGRRAWWGVVFSAGAALSWWSWSSSTRGTYRGRRERNVARGGDDDDDERGRRATDVVVDCVERVRSACASEVIETTARGRGDATRLLTTELLSKCGLRYGPAIRVERGWSPLVNAATVANTAVVESRVCFRQTEDEGGDDTTYDGGAVEYWGTDAGWILDLWTPEPYGATNDTVRITYLSDFGTELMYNTFTHLGNGVFVYERDRLNAKVTVVGVPLDVEEVPRCVHERDDDGTFLWEDSLSLTPTSELDPLYLFKEFLITFLKVLKLSGLHAFFFSEEAITCDEV